MVDFHTWVKPKVLAFHMDREEVIIDEASMDYVDSGLPQDSRKTRTGNLGAIRQA